MSTSDITAAHAAMPQGSVGLGTLLVSAQGGTANQGATNPGATHSGVANNGTTFGNPVFTTFQPANPNVIPNPSIQQVQTINKALKMLNNHQLLMKFATENKQVCPEKLTPFTLGS